MRAFLLTLSVAAAAAAAAVALAAPSGAAPALRPAFSDAICPAKPPRVAHGWARSITAVEPGQVIRAAAAISNEDHAELLFKLGLLEGHLMVGRELIEANQPRLALPHFGHPVREPYDDIQGELKRCGVTSFDGELIALEAMVAGKPRDPATMAKYDGVIRILGAVRATLHGLGVPDGQVLTELFSTPVEQLELDEAAALAAGACASSIEFRRTGKAVPIEHPQTLLDAAEAAGVKLDHSCRNGTCGTCRVKLVSGTVVMGRSDALLKGDVADRLVLACQARPTSAEVLIDA